MADLSFRNIKKVYENGVVAVGAIGACSALINLIISSSMGLSLGVSVAISHDMGSGARENVRRIVNTALVTGACMGVVVCLGGVLLAKPLLALTETPDSVFAEAVPYMRAYFLGVLQCGCIQQASSHD